MLILQSDPNTIDHRPDSCWPGWWDKPWEKPERIAESSDYGHFVCYCEQISEGEIKNALDSPLKPRTLDAIKRRTRVQTGRCQGFDCHVHIAEIISEHCNIPLNMVTKNGPGSAFIVT